MDTEKQEMKTVLEEVNGFQSASESEGLSDGADDGPLTTLSPEESVTEVVTLPQSRVHYCGCGPCRPKRLQVFASAKFFTFLLCTYSLIEGTLVTGFRTVVVSSLEKRYHFSSTSSSIILAAFDVAVVLSVAFYSYFSQKSHKPRILGIGLIIQGVGALVYTFPQFLFGKYEVGSDAKLHLESCDPTNDVGTSCDPANYAAFVFFLVGDFLIGLGASPLFTVGVSFIDDIVHPKYVPIHMGVFIIMAIVGPAIGYGLGGAFLSIYVDPLEVPNVEEKDPGWVGAWWLAFLVGGLLSIVLSIPFFMYPRQLHNTHQMTEERKKETAHNYSTKYGDEKSLLHQVKAFPLHIKKLFESMSWLFTTVAVSLLFFSLDGMVGFGPKYLEAQFGFTASSASLVMGSLAIPTAGLGVLAGAVILYILKSKGRRAAAVNWIALVLCIPPAIAAFLPSCPPLPIAGITTPYLNNSLSTTNDVLLSSCNFDCNCTSTIFEPVCGADGITYFSPCRAGCQKRTLDGVPNRAEFENCSCVAEKFYHHPTSAAAVSEESYWSLVLTNGTATDGRCKQSCSTMPLFLVFVAIFLFLVFVIKIPTYIITLRSVAEEQRTLALGIQSVIFRTFGSIPGPIVYGAVIDSTCLYFHNECGNKGNCWVYDNHQLSTRALISGVTGVILGALFAILAWVFYPRQKPTHTEPAGEEDELQLLNGEDTNDELDNCLDQDDADKREENEKMTTSETTQFKNESTTL